MQHKAFRTRKGLAKDKLLENTCRLLTLPLGLWGRIRKKTTLEREPFYDGTARHQTKYCTVLLPLARDVGGLLPKPNPVTSPGGISKGCGGAKTNLHHTMCAELRRNKTTIDNAECEGTTVDNHILYNIYQSIENNGRHKKSMGTVGNRISSN